MGGEIEQQGTCCGNGGKYERHQRVAAVSEGAGSEEEDEEAESGLPVPTRRPSGLGRDEECPEGRDGDGEEHGEEQARRTTGAERRSPIAGYRQGAELQEKANPQIDHTKDRYLPTARESPRRRAVRQSSRAYSHGLRGSDWTGPRGRRHILAPCRRPRAEMPACRPSRVATAPLLRVHERLDDHLVFPAIAEVVPMDQTRPDGGE